MGAELFRLRIQLAALPGEAEVRAGDVLAFEGRFYRVHQVLSRDVVEVAELEGDVDEGAVFRLAGAERIR